MGERQATLSVKTEDSLLKGSQSAEGRSMDIFDGAANGNEVSWKVSITDPMDMTLEFAGAIEGDRISGSVKWDPSATPSSPAPAPSAAPARSGQAGSGPRTSCSGLRLVHRRLRYARPQSGQCARCCSGFAL